MLDTMPFQGRIEKKGKSSFMDNFIDKLAQKFNAEELIRANTQAENAQMENLQLQVAEYEKVLQEMRKLNYKNVELSAKMEQLLGVNSDKIANLQVDEKKLLDALRVITDEQNKNREELAARDEQLLKQKEEEVQQEIERAQANLAAIDDLFKKSDDYTHKESVKVYRNVQAVVIEEIAKQTMEQETMLRKIKGRSTAALIFGVFSFVMILASLAFQILTAFGIMVF